MHRTVRRLAALLCLTAAAALAPAARAEAPVRANAPAAPVTPAHVDQFEKVVGRDGFWRIGKTAAGVWWFVSPEGKREFLNTVTTVVPRQGSRDRNGALFVSRDWDERLGEQARLEHWAAASVERVRDAGFKGLGAWCSPAFHALDVPITRDLNLSTHVEWSSRRVFSPNWADEIERAVVKQTASLRDNRNLVGYYLDNELDWGDATSGPAAYFNGLANTDPNRREVIAIIRAAWPDAASFNAEWQTTITTLDELETWPVLPHAPQAAYAKLYSAWLARLAEHYFRVTTSLLRRHDPNHLILGVRFRGYAPPEVVRASRDYTDAQSINYYPPDGKLDPDIFPALAELSGQPVIVTEYSFHALDNRSGARNSFGFIAQVPDQAARAEGYRLLTTRLAQTPYVIGADWFQWMDEPPGGRGSDGEDVNFGVVDVDDRAYDPLVKAVRETTPRLNDLHARSDAQPTPDAWRKGYTQPPAARVPYLEKPLRINGELSDWPASASLSGLRVSEVVGVKTDEGGDTPNVMVGWTADGLFIGLEIFDANILATAPTANWWTRDSVELFVATRNVPEGQQHYDPSCHSFFYVPVEYAGTDGRNGVVGQWKRPGDALARSLTSHPDVQQVTRVHADRYVVEMFIPAKALGGFDPANHDTLRFNLLTRDFQQSAEYFWSAPKSAQTHMRPGTWGTLQLMPPEVAKPAVVDTTGEAIP